MVMSGFSQLDLEKRLSQLKDTADSIQTLSAWCLKHKHQHRRIVNSWFKILKRAKVQQRLPLFYLANDVIQYSKRKNLEFVPSFQTVLEGAMPLVRDEKLRPSITRILKIWEDRGIFDSTFTSTLSSVVSNVAKADTKENAEILSDFRTGDLIKHVREVDESEKETDKLLKAINEGEFHVSDTAIEELRNNVKSRSQSKLFVSELEEGVRAVERYVSALDREIQQRAELIEQLERSEIYYETQRTDAKVVAVAYKNFSKRVREVKRKLDELVPELPDVSPVPSPDINAPSPTNSDDGLQLPDDGDGGPAAAAEARAGGDAASTDPRSEIERLLGSWTAGSSGGSADAKIAGAENGATDLPGIPAAAGGSFLGLATPFPAGLTAELFPRRAGSPPPSDLQQVSSIAVVTGVQKGGTVSSQNTPQDDDQYYDEEEERETGGATSQPLSDLMRLIGRKLQAEPAPEPPAVHIPGLDLTRPPPALPDTSHPPPPPPPLPPPPPAAAGGLWSAPPPPQPHRHRSWEEADADGPRSPPAFEKGNSAYNSQIDLPPAFKAVEESRLPFVADTDHRVLPPPPPPVPPPVPPPAPPSADLDLRQPVSDASHRLWDRSVDDFISQVTEDRDYRRRVDADYRPPPTDLAGDDDHHSLDMEISDEEGHAARRGSSGGAGTPGRAPRRVSAGTPSRARSGSPAATGGDTQAVELVELDDDDLPQVTTVGADSLEAIDDPSVSSWSSSIDSLESADDEPRGSQHRSSERRRKRRRHDSGGRRRKERRRSQSSTGKRRHRRPSDETRYKRSDSDDKEERRKKAKAKKRSRDRSRDRDRGRSREREREREKHRSRDRDRERDRHQSRDKTRSRDARSRERGRERSRSRDRRHDGGGGGSSFDYSQVGAGAHKAASSSSSSSTHRDRSSRRW